MRHARYYNRFQGTQSSANIEPVVNTTRQYTSIRQYVQTQIGRANNYRIHKSPVADVVRAFQNLPRGYSIVSDEGGIEDPNVPVTEEQDMLENRRIFLAGYTLREICTMADAAHVPRETLFLTADVIDFELRSRNSAGDVHPRQAFYINDTRRRIVTPYLRRLVGIPLSEVQFAGADFQGQEGIVNILQAVEEEFLATYAGGSGAPTDSTYVLYQNIRIEKRYPFPQALRGTWTFRTGGFDRIFLQDNMFSFGVSALIENLRCSQSLQRIATVEIGSYLMNANEVILFNPGSLSRYLDGFMNCVAQCLHWGLYMEALQCTETCLESPAHMTPADRLSIYQDVRKEVFVLCNAFFENWINGKRREISSSSSNDHGKTEYIVRRWTREWSAMVRHGFSNVLLRRFSQHLRSYDIDFDIFAYNNGTEAFTSIINGDPSIIQYYLNASRIRSVHCFQMNLLGEIQRITPRGMTPQSQFEVVPDSGSGIFPGLLHCITTFPSIPKKLLTSTEISASLLKILNPEIKRQLAVAAEQCDPNCLKAADNPEVFERLIYSQRLRMMKTNSDQVSPQYASERRTTIDMEDYVESAAPIPFSSSYRFDAGKQKVGVIVYDLETVENLRGCQDKVHPQFRKAPPLVPNPNIYSTPESQIPYSVQWGIVNMEATAEEIRDYPERILLKPVAIEYGNEEDSYLGECVQDFIDKIAEDAMANKWSKVYCYAHNGCGFDAYLILKYAFAAHVNVKRILITPRGILSLNLVVHDKVHLIFRDTKVFFASRLSDLCKIFRVPERFCKTDFPITRVHARNYDHPPVRGAYHEYLVNDVWSLAFIVHSINAIIEKEILKETEKKPFHGICRFVTLMSLVTQLQRDVFAVMYKAPQPPPVDIPGIRNYICYANMGGRVMPFWRHFKSSCTNMLLRSLLREWKAESPKEKEAAFRATCHARMIEHEDYGTVLDVTSLYPYAMSHFPMPTGMISTIENANEFFYSRIVPVLDCVKCHAQLSLCADHLPEGVKNLRQHIGFSIFVVRDLHFSTHLSVVTAVDTNEYLDFKNLCGRKTAKGGSLLYSFEDPNVINSRGDLTKSLPDGCSSYTMYDLYWMMKAGWKFTIVSAFGFDSTYYFRSKILDMYENRKAAKVREKEEGLPKSLSTMWKNSYNGMYGVNAKKDIQTQHITTKDMNMSEMELRRTNRLGPDEHIVYDSASHQLSTGQWLLKIKKHADSAEYFSEQSPNHIGAAVTSAARHHMNLLLFSLKSTECGYTDTDSAFVVGSVLKKIQAANPLLLDENPDANMGTYKNDHEGPGNNIVFLSFLLAKKVKLHLTVNAAGEIQFHETFKGMNPTPICPVSGKALSGDAISFQKIRALGEIFFQGVPTSSVPQSEWRRSVAEGITIDKNAKFEGNRETYYGAGAGDASVWIPGGGYLEESTIELMIPPGWPSPDITNPDPIVEHLIDGKASLDHHKFADVVLYYTWADLIETMEKRIIDEMVHQSEENEAERQWDDLFAKAPALVRERDYSW